MINGGLSEDEVMASFEDNRETHQAREDARVRGSQMPMEEAEGGEETTSEYRLGNRIYSDSRSGLSWLDILVGREEEIQSRPRAEVLDGQLGNQRNREEGLGNQLDRRLPKQGQDNVPEWNPDNENLQAGWIKESDEEVVQVGWGDEPDEEAIQAEESGSRDSYVLAINIWDSSDEAKDDDVWVREESKKEDPEEEEEDPEEENPGEKEEAKK